MKNQQYTETLTVENASKVSTVIHKEHPEWGTKRFNYMGQPLNDGRYAHTLGDGSSVLFDSDMKFWMVASYK